MRATIPAVQVRGEEEEDEEGGGGGGKFTKGLSPCTRRTERDRAICADGMQMIAKCACQVGMEFLRKESLQTSNEWRSK